MKTKLCVLAAVAAAYLLAPGQAQAEDWKLRTISPVANPLFFEDPQINSEVRPIFAYHNIYNSFVTGGGDVRVYAAQLRYAVNDRLAIIATKDGYIDANLGPLGHQSGWADLAAGLKYALIDDKENEFILTPGFRLTLPTGNKKVFQGTGKGEWDVFVSSGKGWGNFHATANAGLRLPNDMNQSTALAHYSAQLDYYTCQYFIPFISLNAMTVLNSAKTIGLPVEGLSVSPSENAEIYVPEMEKWLEIRTRYLNWVDGRLAQMVIASDITPRRRAEAQSAQQAERAQSVSRLITMGEMASSVAHELNQPLTAISNYCNGLVTRIKNKQINDQDMLMALEKTAHQAQRAGQIIQRIRSFVKRSEPNRTLTHVARMVSEAVELADIELRRQQVRLSYFVSSRLPPLNVDPILIEQVMINLLKNASESIQHAQRAPADRHVELQVVPREIEGQSVVEFSVIDTGNGLSSQGMERLFEAFYSTKAEGMGIGLNLCRSIVESHQGRMQAENLYNGDQVQGCRFSFWIPVRQPLVTV